MKAGHLILLMILIHFGASSAAPVTHQLTSLRDCLIGPLSHPIDTDDTNPRMRGQSFYIESVLRGIQPHTYDVLVLPKLNPGEPETITFTLLYENMDHQLRSESLTVNKSALLDPLRPGIYDSSIVFSNHIAQCLIGIGIYGPCPLNPPLAFRVKLVPFASGKSTQIVMRQTFDSQWVLPGKIIEAGATKTDKFDQDKLLATILDDMTQHILQLENRALDPSNPPNVIMNVIRQCRPSVATLRGLVKTPGGTFDLSLNKFAGALDMMEVRFDPTNTMKHLVPSVTH